MHHSLQCCIYLLWAAKGEHRTYSTRGTSPHTVITSVVPLLEYNLSMGSWNKCVLIVRVRVLILTISLRSIALIRLHYFNRLCLLILSVGKRCRDTLLSFARVFPQTIQASPTGLLSALDLHTQTSYHHCSFTIVS